MSKPRSFAGFFFAALRHKKRGGFLAALPLKKNLNILFQSYFFSFYPQNYPFSKKLSTICFFK